MEELLNRRIKIGGHCRLRGKTKLMVVIPFSFFPKECSVIKNVTAKTAAEPGIRRASNDPACVASVSWASSV